MMKRVVVSMVVVLAGVAGAQTESAARMELERYKQIRQAMMTGQTQPVPFTVVVPENPPRAAVTRPYQGSMEATRTFSQLYVPEEKPQPQYRHWVVQKPRNPGLVRYYRPTDFEVGFTTKPQRVYRTFTRPVTLSNQSRQIPVQKGSNQVTQWEYPRYPEIWIYPSVEAMPKEGIDYPTPNGSVFLPFNRLSGLGYEDRIAIAMRSGQEVEIKKGKIFTIPIVSVSKK